MSLLHDLHEDRAVCSNCYRRKYIVHDQSYVPDESYPDGVRPSRDVVPDQRYERVLKNTSRDPASEPTHGLRTACECGTFGHHDSPGVGNGTPQERFMRAVRRLEDDGVRLDTKAASKRFVMLSRDTEDDRPTESKIESAIEFGHHEAIEPQ